MISMNDGKNIKISVGKLIFILTIIALLVSSATYAYWKWTSNVNKNVVFTTMKGLEEYIVYNAGDSHFVGNFQPKNTFCERGLK